MNTEVRSVKRIKKQSNPEIVADIIENFKDVDEVLLLVRRLLKSNEILFDKLEGVKCDKCKWASRKNEARETENGANQILDIYELSLISGYSVPTIRKALLDKKLKATQRGKHHKLLFSQEQVNNFLTGYNEGI